MAAQNRAHRIIDNVEGHSTVIYDPEHDIGVDFAWIDMQLFELCVAQQEQIEELAARITKLETLKNVQLVSIRRNIS